MLRVWRSRELKNIHRMTISGTGDDVMLPRCRVTKTQFFATLMTYSRKQALAGAAGAIGGASNTGSMRGRKRKSGSGSTSISLDPAVRSVFASRDGLRLLVGTRGGELYEMSTADGSDAAGGGRGGEIGGVGPLTAGHGRGQVRYSP